MTDIDDTTAADAADLPEPIATHYLTSTDDVVEHLRAASQLGLGARVRNYLEPDEDGQTYAERWELELLTAAPVQTEEE